MATDWIRRVLRSLQGSVPSRLYLSRERESLPAWVVRDIGLDDPENGKAVKDGHCRKAEARSVPHIDETRS